MAFFIGLLTVIMVLDCVLLILLVLMQLPKKDAGAGLAFGGAATDALFGAGSGNFLTKTTKYAAIVFFVFALLISVLQSQYSRRPNSEFRRLLDQQSKQLPAAAPAATQAPAPAGPSVARGTNNIPLLEPTVGTPNSSNSAPAPE